MSEPRLSKVARFDTVVFNPRTRILEVWRYNSGRYPGVHEVIFSNEDLWVGSTDWMGGDSIKVDEMLRGVATIIGMTAQLCTYSREYHLPAPWIGYRFV